MSDLPFEPLRLLGSGATGSVTLCRLLEPLAGLAAGSEVAVKILAPELRDDERARESFRAEAEAGTRVDDPSLARVLDHGEGPDGPYLVLQYVPGRSLREVLDAEGALPEPVVRSIAAQLTGALAALHAEGIVHGDVKPENVRLDDAGRAVLLDLGLAVDLTETDEAGRESHAGSLAYLSPERAQGSEPTEAADVYALGVTLYEIATGVHPFGAATAESGQTRPRSLQLLASTSSSLLLRGIEEPGADELLAAITRGGIELPSHLVPQLTPFLDALLVDMLRRAAPLRPPAAILSARFRAGEAGDWWRSAIDRDPAHSPAPRPEQERRWLLPLIGGERELSALAEIWQEVRGGPPATSSRSAVVMINGPVASGKWRLINEFVTRVRASDSPPQFLRTRCTSTAESRPAGALLYLLRRWLQLPPGLAPGPREVELLGDLVPPRTTRTLLETLGAPQEAQERESVPAALAAWLAALGRAHPVVVFVDDLECAGAVTLDALSVVVGSLGDTRVLLALALNEDLEAAQPELLGGLLHRLDRWSESARPAIFRCLRLDPVDEDAIRKMTRELFHPTTPHVRLAATLFQRSRGNPGMVEEILRDLLERGSIVARSDRDPRLVLRIPPREIPPPRSLDRLIAERFERLEPEERRWLQRMAVVGPRITPEVLIRSFPPTGRAEVDEVLVSLVRNGWMIFTADHYHFERPALREAVLRSLSHARRIRLHRRVAKGLVGDGTHALRPRERFRRVFHLRSAREHEAVQREVRALIRDLRHHASARRLYNLARWGLEALEAKPPATGADRLRLELLEAAADAADRMGNREDQRILLDHLVDHGLDPESHPAEGARVYLLHGRYAASTGQGGLARGMLRNAVALAVKSGVRELQSEALRRLAEVQGQIGELDEARLLSQRALSLAADPNQIALAQLSLATIDILEDRVEDARRQVSEALGALRGRRRARLWVVAQAHLIRARIWRTAGRPQRALGAAQRALHLARRAGQRGLGCEARARLGGLLVDLDRTEEAEMELRHAVLVAEEIEDRRGGVLAGITLGLLLYENDDDSARASLERATARAREIGYHRAEAMGLAVLARVDRESGALALADEGSLRAVELLERHGAELADRITIEGTRALVLQDLGRTGEAQILLRVLRRRMRRSNRAIPSERMRRAQHDYISRLLETVLSQEGPVTPRSPGSSPSA